MYKHILVSTDASRPWQKAIRAAARLAKAPGARVTGVYVMPEYVPPLYDEATL